MLALSTTQLRQARLSSVWAPSCQDVTPGGHAGVGVIGLQGAPLSLPTLLDSSFKEFFRLGRAMRVFLPLGNGGVVHLFVVYGYQGSDNDPEKLQLTEHLFAAVLAEARLCCAGQPVVLAGDFNVEPFVNPSLAKGISDGHWVDLEYAFSFGRGVPPSSTCQFQLDEDKGSRRDFILACPIALAAASMCSVLSDRWFTPHLLSMRSLRSLLGTLLLNGPGFIPPCGLLAGWIAPIAPDLLRPRLFVIFGMFTFVRVGFVPFEVRSNLFRLCHSSDVDSSWLLGSREAEASLTRAYLAAGGPPLSNSGSYVGRGALSICTMRLGGRCHGRIHSY